MQTEQTDMRTTSQSDPPPTHLPIRGVRLLLPWKPVSIHGYAYGEGDGRIPLPMHVLCVFASTSMTMPIPMFRPRWPLQAGWYGDGYTPFLGLAASPPIHAYAYAYACVYAYAYAYVPMSVCTMGAYGT